MFGVIGGSGFEKFDAFEKVKDLDRNTPFGEASSGLKLVKVATTAGTTECVFLPRHGERHELCPSEVNYRANIFALKKHGVRKLLAFSAVGSLREELAPGDMVIPYQYLDRTKSYRQNTFCGGGVVGHVSLAEPIWRAGAHGAENLVADFDFRIHRGKTYVCVEGPYFSTQAESHWYRRMKADIIGMTAYPEYGLAREAGLCYLPCCFVTDYDCWNTEIEHVTLDQVLETMRKNNAKAFAFLQAALVSSWQEDAECREGGLRTGLMSPWDSHTDEQKAWLEVLRS